MEESPAKRRRLMAAWSEAPREEEAGSAMAEFSDLDHPGDALGSLPRCSSPKLSDCGITDESFASFISEVDGELEEEEEEEEEEEAQVMHLDHCGVTEQLMESFISEVEGDEEEWPKEREEEEERPEEEECDGEEGWGGVAAMQLPNEVLEMVLCRLPLRELLGSARLVCRRWNGVVSREKFLLWKKRYFMYKSGRCPSVTATIDAEMEGVVRVCVPLWHTPIMPASQTPLHPENCILRTVRYISERLRQTVVGEGLLGALQTHPQYSCVRRMMEVCPELSERPSLGAVETAFLLVVCSSSVSQVRSVLHSFLGPLLPLRSSHCSYLAGTEVFYCFATVLFALWDMRYLPPRFHYYVYYSLSLLEGEGREDSSVQAGQMTSSVSLTSEQVRIINHRVKAKELVKIVALAGTGKTTTLLHYTLRNPAMRFLYLVYNKSVQEHASGLFPHNVKATTFHSLAFRGEAGGVGWKYSSRDQLIPNVEVHNISQWMSGKYGKRRGDFYRSVFDTLENFLMSADTEVSHLPQVSEEEEEEEEAPAVGSQSEGEVVAVAAALWRRMIDLNDKEAKMSHDGYLKLFQLSRPQITGYDCILVDEAQDLNSAIIDILKGQSCPMMLVGDPHQQIYSFRGAQNAMGLFTATATFHLTRSFRFGPEIAYVAALVLDVLKHERRQTLVGGSQEGDVWGLHDDGPIAVIARTNAGLFGEMALVADRASRSRTCIRIGFAGGIKRYEFGRYKQLHRLQQGNPTNICGKLYRHFVDLKCYAEINQLVSLLLGIKVCERYAGRLLDIIAQLEKMAVGDMSLADVVFSTAHKSKGLEFDTVRMVDDFLICEIGKMEKLNPDEKNLAYVAATRAKRRLIMSRTLFTVLMNAKEFFVFPSSVDISAADEVVCPACRFTLAGPLLPLRKATMKLNADAGCVTVTGGLVCQGCSRSLLPCLSFSPASAFQ